MSKTRRMSDNYTPYVGASSATVFVDKARSSAYRKDDGEDSNVGSLEISADQYSLLKGTLSDLARNKRLSPRVKALNSSGGVYLVMDTDVQKGGTFFLNVMLGLPVGVSPLKEQAGWVGSIRLILKRRDEQCYLNMDFNPTKFLSGQNVVGVVDDGTWFGYPVEHTPAGYIELGFKVLRLLLRKSLGGEAVEKSIDWVHGMYWSQFDLTDYLPFSSTGDRDYFLRVLVGIADRRFRVSRKRGGDGGGKDSLSINLGALLQLETWSAGDSACPTFYARRLSPKSSRTQDNVVPAYTLVGYAKDVELEDAAAERVDGRNVLGSLSAGHLKLIRVGMRLEIQVLPATFVLPGVRDLIREQGWLSESEDKHWFDGAARRWKHCGLLQALFPDVKTFHERANVLAQYLWRESHAPLLLTPPSVETLRLWATGYPVKPEAACAVVKHWMKLKDQYLRGEVESEVLGNAQAFYAAHKDMGFTRDEMGAFYLAFADRFCIDLRRVPYRAVDYLRSVQHHAVLDSTMEADLESARTVRDDYALALHQAEGSGDQESARYLQVELAAARERVAGLERSRMEELPVRLAQFEALTTGLVLGFNRPLELFAR